MELVHDDGVSMWYAYTVDELHGIKESRKHVVFRGWIKTIRHSKAGMSFIHVTDGSCLRPYQIFVKKTVEGYDEIKKLTSGCSIEVHGEVVESKGKGQDFELITQTLKIHGLVEDPATYPIQAKDTSMEYLRSVAHLRPRSQVFSAITRVRTELAQATQSFFYGKGYQWIHTPIITGSDCEGGGEMFRVSTDSKEEFFGKPAFLTVSGQLNVEPFACSMGKVYTFGPTFRAENSQTSRHLSEFWMIEPETAFYDLDDNVRLATDFLQTIFRSCLDYRHEDLEYLAGQFRDGQMFMDTLERVITEPPERMTYTEAIKILETCGESFEFPVSWGIDLQSEHEKFLCEYVGGKILVVTDYPKDIKAFYMKLSEDEKTVGAMDILLPGIGEIIGGSQREERHDVLLRRIKEMGLDQKEYDWYLDLRKYGTVPHSGFGLGFERAVQYITGVPNIRDTIPYPRAVGKLEY